MDSSGAHPYIHFSFMWMVLPFNLITCIHESLFSEGESSMNITGFF